jgi:phenylacetic acid degradation protein
MNVPPRTLVAGVPAKIVREVTDEELAWKIEGTQGYHELSRRSLATMVESEPLPRAEANRRRIELPELLPLSMTKARGR